MDCSADRCRVEHLHGMAEPLGPHVATAIGRRERSRKVRWRAPPRATVRHQSVPFSNPDAADTPQSTSAAVVASSPASGPIPFRTRCDHDDPYQKQPRRSAAIVSGRFSTGP